MKKYFVILLLLFPVLTMAQGQKGTVEECAPMKKGKVCYNDEVEMPGVTQTELFRSIVAWAKKSYGRDVFLSNISSNEKIGTILVSSKVELLLNETEKTYVKYKMNITCFDNKYTTEVSNIYYQYDPENKKRLKTYKAEDVIADNGKSNTIAVINDPVLFCNATFFFVESLLADVLSAASEK